jgi:hypothetical protein
MAHPKVNIQKHRRDKRRTHYKATPPTVVRAQTADLQFSITGYALNVVITEVSWPLRKGNCLRISIT